jgi:hypothetical protein
MAIQGKIAAQGDSLAPSVSASNQNYTPFEVKAKNQNSSA